MYGSHLSPTSSSDTGGLEGAGEALARLVMRRAVAGEVVSTDIAGISLYRSDAPTEPTSCMYEPSVALIVQGAKRVLLGEESYAYRAKDFLITSVDLPALGQVVDATPARPCLVILMKLDPRAVARMLLDGGLPAVQTPPSGRAIDVGEAPPPLLDAFRRLLDLLDTPSHIPVLAPLVQREIVYRLLLSDQGGRLRQIASAGTQGHRIARAIEWLKVHYAQPLRVDDLAAQVQMSASTFHHHFRALTAMSPLQYQKWLRLNEARRLMLVEQMDASTAAAQVGYESASQFSREYKRQFGVPPRRDMEGLRRLHGIGVVAATLPAAARAPAPTPVVQ